MNNIPKSQPMTAGRAGLPLDHAPRDGQTLRLLVRYSADEEPGRWTPLEDEFESWTIGHNSLDNTGEDVWVFVGWDWSQDYYLQAISGTVVGWLPFHDAAEPDLLMPLLKLANAVDPLVATPPIVGPITQGVRDALTEARQALAAHQAGEKVSAPSQGDDLSWLSDRTNLELDYSYGDDETEEGRGWRIHRVSGGRNDREWEMIATADTPANAIAAAREILAPNTTGKAPEAAREGGI